MCKVYFPPDDFQTTKETNLFTAEVQCLLGDGSWHSVASIDGEDKKTGMNGVLTPLLACYC